MFNIFEIIIKKIVVVDSVPHRDIDLAMKKSEIINNLKLVDFKIFFDSIFGFLGQKCFYKPIFRSREALGLILKTKVGYKKSPFFATLLKFGELKNDITPPIYFNWKSNFWGIV